MDIDILKKDEDGFVSEMQRLASECTTRSDIEKMESFLEDLQVAEYENGNREFYQQIIDSCLVRIDMILGQHVLSNKCNISEESVSEAIVENKVVIGFRDISNKKQKDA
jgi:hypothetical protein